MLRDILRRRASFTSLVAVLALVLAMSGGAIAASKYLITSTKQISPKVLKSLKGARGPAGAKGSAGAVGTPGLAGPKGESGAPGGTGASGTNGQNVTSVALAKGNEHCKEGGSELKGASGAAFACNGAPGKEGKEGAPWPAGGTLPSESTETGIWSFGPEPSGVEKTQISVPVASFTIPLASPLDQAHVHYINENNKELIENEATEELEEVTSTACLGTVDKPSAEPGNLCVYARTFVHSITLSGLIKAGVAGAELNVILRPEGKAEPEGRGTWAVTG
jgi:hypothetical protein